MVSKQMSESNLYAKVSRTHYGAYLQKQPEGNPRDQLERQGCYLLGTQSALNRIEEITIMFLRIEQGWKVLYRGPNELFEDQREFLECDDDCMGSMVGLKKFALGY